MKNIFLSFMLICCMSSTIYAQIDTLGKSPFFFYDMPVETGIYHDSEYCVVHGYYSEISYETITDELLNDIRGLVITEYAIHMYTEDTIRIVGIALGPHQSGHTLRLSIYDEDGIEHDAPPLASTTAPPCLYSVYYYDYTGGYGMDSNYLRFLDIPGWTNPYIINRPCSDMGGDSRYMWLSFFGEDEVLDIAGDFYVGVSERIGESGMLPYNSAFIEEVHGAPYHIAPRPIRFRKNKVWIHDTLWHSFPLLFPLVEPKCRAVDAVRTTIDSAGCLVAEWDSLPHQEQWVVALNVQGHASTMLDTVDSNRWTYCDLPAGASYQISVRSRCTNLNSYTWSDWNSPIELGIASAEAGNTFGVSPNPTAGLVRLSLPPSAAQGCQVEVYSVDGRRVTSRRLAPSQTTLDLGALPSGLYLLRLLTPQGMYTNKVLLRR